MDNAIGFINSLPELKQDIVIGSLLKNKVECDGKHLTKNKNVNVKLKTTGERDTSITLNPTPEKRQCFTEERLDNFKL